MNLESRRRAFEKLESRECMAGNVTATIVDGNLTALTGDDSNNNVTVLRAGALIYIIGTRTTINGAPFATATSTSGPLTIDMGNGNDKLALTNLKVGGPLTVTGGLGSDVLGLANIRTDGDVHVYSGTALATGSGNDVVAIANLKIRSEANLIIYGGDGNDLIGLTNVDAFHLSVFSGEGNDTVWIHRMRAMGSIYADVGDGDDTLVVNHSSAGFVTFYGGLGNDRLQRKNNQFAGEYPTVFFETIVNRDA